MTSVDEEQHEARVPSHIRPGAIAERTLSATLSPNQLVDLTNETRFDLLRSTPQVNHISADRGNSAYLSGGASIANALILSSSTAIHAKANSKALFKIVDAFNAKDKANGLRKPFSLSVEEEIALQKL